ncbi:MAG: hypothetical protein AAGA48_26325 [Myxococcota bacterium]
MWLLQCFAAWAQPIEEETVSRVGENEGILVSFGALYGAYLGGEAVYLANANDPVRNGPIGWGMLAGGAAGSVTGYVLSVATDPTPEVQTMLYTSAVHGGFYGFQLGRSFIPVGADGRDSRLHAAGIAGSMAGLGLGLAVRKRAPSLADQGRLTLATSVGWLAATGINDLNRETDLADPNRARVTLATAALFSGVGIVANRLGAQPGAAALSLNLSHGAWIGAWVPRLVTRDPSGRQITGGLRLGLGLGYAGALVTSAIGEPSPRSAGLQAVGWAAGSALGAGLPLALQTEDDDPVVIASMLTGGVVGQIAGGVLAPHYRLEPNDRVLLASLSTWSAYQAVGWGIQASLDQDTGRQPLGVALTTGGLGAVAAVGLSPVLDVDPSGSVMLLTSGAWGSWYGAWAAAQSEDPWVPTLIAGNGLLVASGLAQAAGWRPDWRDVAAINGVGLVGAAGGALTGVVFLFDNEDSTPLVASTLVGTTVGLGAGVALSALRPARPRTALFRPLRRLGWLANVGATPLLQEGSPGAMVTVNLKEVALN